MSTKVTDSNGNLLWSPNDFGSYSTEKVELITKILSNLLSDITLNMNTRVDEDSLSNIYTISQTHEKFLEKENASETISMAVISVLQTMYEDGRLVNPTVVDVLKGFISNLYSSCYGIDLNGNNLPSAASSYNSLIDSLRVLIDSNYSNILKIFNVVFETNIDGSYTNVSKVAKASDMGDIRSLDKSISDRDSIVEAINYIALNNSNVGGNVSNLIRRVSTVEGDVDTLRSNVSSLGTRVSSLENGLSNTENNLISLSNRVSSSESRLGVNEGNISNMRTELTTAESDIKTIQTNLGDKTSLTTSEKSSIVSAINSVVRSLMSIETGMSSIEARMSSIEARLNSLESGIS